MILKYLKPKKIIILLFFSITTISNAQQLSLKEAYTIMLNNNGDINASNYNVKASEEEVKATKGLYYPSISVSASYLSLDKDLSVDLNSKRDMVGSLLQIPNPEMVLGNWDVTLQEKNLGYASANIELPVFAGGKIKAANKAAAINLNISTNKHNLKEEELTLNLLDYYYKLKLAIEIKKLRNQVYNTVQIHKIHADKLFINGLIPEVETLNAKVSLADANRELLGAIKDVSLAKTAVQNYIGNTKFDSITTPFKTPQILPPLQILQQEMLQSNKKLTLLKYHNNLAEIGADVEKSNYYPEIGFFGKSLFWKDNLPLINTKWLVGVGLEWNLFDGLKREHSIKAAEHKISQVKEIEKQAQLNLLTYTEKLYNTIQKEIEQYETLETNQQFAQKLKYMRTRAFEEGTGTSLDVIDATLKLSEIKLLKLKALYNYTIAYGELMIELGKTEEFLNKN